MDPNVALEELLELVALVQEAQDAEYSFREEVANEKLIEMAELVKSLDGWIQRGGFLPHIWDVKGGSNG